MEPDFTPPGQRDTVIPRFYIKAVQNNFRSEQEGHPVFEDREYVEIIVPGNRGSTVDRMVKPEDRDRWPTIYAAFQRGVEAPTEGTPLREWAVITRSMAEELAYFNVRTVEDLAGLSDANLQKAIPQGGMALREKARSWLAQAEGTGEIGRLQQRAELAEDTTRQLQAQLSAALERLDKLEKEKADA